MLVVEIQHPTPYYDDSYAVNSENNGPYGDAITYELIPYIEEQFRGIGEGWARFTYGGSTGGWEALAVQIFYPDDYNGSYGACPDPIDFRAYELVNIYDDTNAYSIDRDWGTTYRPGPPGLARATCPTRSNRRTTWRRCWGPGAVPEASGTSGRRYTVLSAEDGYPQPIFDKMTGALDHDVAGFWRENYDLRYILERDWAEPGAASPRASSISTSGTWTTTT